MSTTPTIPRKPKFDRALFRGPADHYNEGPAETREPILACIYTEEQGRWQPSIVDTADQGYGFDYTLCGTTVYQPNCSGLDSYDAAARTARLPAYSMHDGSALPLHKLWIDRTRIKTLLDPQGHPCDAERLKALGWQLLARPLVLHPSMLVYDHYTDDEVFDPFHDSTCSDCIHIEYCSVCRGHYTSDNMCHHVMWTEAGGGWSEGIGCSENNLQEVKRSLFDLCDALPPEVVAIMRRLLTEHPAKFDLKLEDRDELRGEAELDLGAFHQWKAKCGLEGMWNLTINLDALADEVRGAERYWPGIAWLYSLDAKLSPATTALTLGWLYERDHHLSSAVSPLDYMTFHELPKAEFDQWMAKNITKPLTTEDVLRFKLPAKGKRCRNDLYMASCPEGLRYLGLLIKDRSKSKDYRSLYVSIAQARTDGKCMAIQPGRIIKRDRGESGRDHASWHEGYDLIGEQSLAWIRKHTVAGTFWPAKTKE